MYENTNEPYWGWFQVWNRDYWFQVWNRDCWFQVWNRDCWFQVWNRDYLCNRTHYQLVCNCVTVGPDQTFGWNPGYMTQSVTFQRDKGGWHSANANQHRLYHLFNFVHISQNDSLTLVPLRDSLNEHTLMCSWPSSDCCSHNLWWVTVCDHMTTY